MSELEESNRIPDIPEIRSAWVADQERHGYLVHTESFDKRLRSIRAEQAVVILGDVMQNIPLDPEYRLALIELQEQLRKEIIE